MVTRVQDLYTFFVIARAGSMQKAAQELGVTPGAISQRVRAIEENCAKRLFSRSRKGIELTKAGNILWQDLEASFLQIEDSYQQHFTHNLESHIRISAAPTFGYSCLVPRLGEFSAANPNIKITIETDDRIVDLRTEPIDLAIRHGLGKYPGFESQWLSSPELIVVASPSLLQQGQEISEAIDCLNYTLIQNSGSACSDWNLWCQARNIDDSKAHYGPAFKDDFLIVKAALEGQGLALLHDIYVQDDLKEHRLIQACKAAWPTEFAYYAVTTKNTLERPAIQKFITWLKSISN